MIMSNLILYPSLLKGNITIPPSKSMCHRGIICAGLAKGLSVVNNISLSEDILATLNAIKALGANIEVENLEASSMLKQDILSIEGEVFKGFYGVKINGGDNKKEENIIIDCYESGSTLRFLVPIAAALGINAVFLGKGRLGDRPLRDYYNIFDSQKLKYSNCNGKLPLTIEGKLMAGDYKVSGNVSSQYISGLLMALPLLEGTSKILIDSRLESRPYVDMTIKVLERFSIEIENHDYKEFLIIGNQRYKPCNYMIEGDYSRAAFWLVAGLIGNNIDCIGLNNDTVQGDKVILDIIQKFGGTYKVRNLTTTTTATTTYPGITTSGVIIDGAECPDLIPIVAVLAALSKGKTQIINSSRLRFKESDRLKAIASELNKIGAKIIEKQDGLEIDGVEAFSGGVVDSWNDHRIAMAMAIASTRCKGPLTLKGSECVKKSYPNFWEHFKLLGGNSSEWNLG
jgi:3-phosphoshikimate 1-carboxyvinyltransferase